ncbi:MAG: FAD-dependent oxidoreductase, partial [Betaproteobacteria bacterium]
LISDHVTLSTMHGCPPGEIEKIGLYLVREKRLHTTIKLNPTLLGAKELRGLLNTKLGFTTEVPDIAFEHDLKYPDALLILDSLSKASAENGLQFGVKLTNTLESVNNKTIFGPAESMMYMSGRALHPVSIRLAAKLQQDLNGMLDISFSAGADCFNIADVISCGMKPVTVCSDLLKPGGYGRLHQYIENLRTEFISKEAGDIDCYISKVAGHPAMAALSNLKNYADWVAENPAYHKRQLSDPTIKTSRPLGWFDCIHAPCTDTCPTNQDIPGYMRYTAEGDFTAAFETIFRTNPFPSVTGMVCDHPCQQRCTRINYDEALRIREVKRFVAGQGNSPQSAPPEENGKRVAVIGAGPAGLSCAWFLRQAGFGVDLFEQKRMAGGMVASAIPSFRLTDNDTETDIRRILASGVQLHDNHPVDKIEFEHLLDSHTSVFLASGAQQSVKLSIEGAGLQGVIDPLDFLFNFRQNRNHGLGNHIVIIGGGNTAMDAARTAFRLVGEQGSVTIVYRRTVKEMPADQGEIEAVLAEGIRIIELTT